MVVEGIMEDESNTLRITKLGKVSEELIWLVSWWYVGSRFY